MKDPTRNSRQQFQWKSDGFQFGEFEFVPVIDETIGSVRVDYPRFILMKDAANVAAYAANLSEKFSSVLELGIMKGGSCAFFEALLKPDLHLAIDVNRFDGDGLKELSEYVAKKGRRLLADYQTSQADIPRILDLWQGLSGRRDGFDLIVDDASHSYALSKDSFNGLFPLLRPGGVYVIEDWGWAHWRGPWQDPAHSEFGNPSLSNLVVQAAFSITGGSGMVESANITPNAVFIVRGTSPAASFDVAASYLVRGRPKTPF